MSTKPKAVEWVPARVGDEPGYRLMVILAAPGCAWARETGGCTNCGFSQTLASGHSVSADEYASQIEAALETVPTLAGAPIEIDLYVSGSFLNPEEVPPLAQQRLLRAGAQVLAVERILIETRPEYATEQALSRAVSATDGKTLEVAIGLESANDVILRERIRKGFGWDDFEAAARRVAGAGAHLLVYLLLKPIDTTEPEAIEDTASSAERVFALGRTLAVPTRIALEPCFVAPGTPLAEAHASGRYRPPWLWSVVEVVRRVAPLGQVVVGLSDEGLAPASAAHNCELCTPRFREALARFNVTQQLEELLSLRCGCRAAWEAVTFPA